MKDKEESWMVRGEARLDDMVQWDMVYLWCLLTDAIEITSA